MVHRRTARLAKWQIWLLSLNGVGLWLSGSAWLLLHYYGQTKGEFGPEMNPLEPWMMKLHGLVLIPALLGIGDMLVAHTVSFAVLPKQAFPTVHVTAIDPDDLALGIARIKAKAVGVDIE